MQKSSHTAATVCIENYECLYKNVKEKRKYMAEHIIAIGILLIIIGIVAVIAGAALSGKDTKAEYAVVGFIGPLPFGFGSSEKMLYVAIAVTAVVIALFLFLRFRGV